MKHIFRQSPLLAVLLGGFLTLTSSASAAAPPPGEPVVIGMIQSMFRDIPKVMLAPLSKPFTNLMRQQTGVPGELNVSANAMDLANRLQKGEVHIGVFHGFEYAWVQTKYPELTPLVIAVPRCKTFQACLVVNADGTCQCWGDLCTKKVALPRGSREHCRLFLDRHGKLNDNSSMTVCKPRSVMDALDDVVDGMADATVVDKAAMESFARVKSGRAAKLKVVAESEIFPASVVVYRRDSLVYATVDRFRQALTSAHRTRDGRRLMLLWNLKGFAEVPQDYPGQLERIRSAYPLAESVSGAVGGVGGE